VSARQCDLNQVISSERTRINATGSYRRDMQLMPEFSDRMGKIAFDAAPAYDGLGW
jgi:hypothetical protein